ncbi:hypothetical protein BCR34DRAFT_582456 [Clohesyomyces aquaticus]|uniref:Uncharacterized protein n=1 Tax=Clohesyomyces aquaticus TaxID=1231657 RepID=A0A1Y2AA23_9PLEO|nr:hypothetical protein BCR34DRAFT_582456 [Clohesyomyces aquaticus]
MDFTKLQSINIDSVNNLMTLTSIPASILEAFIPEYGVLSQIMLKLLGFDIGLVVTASFLVYALRKGLQPVYHRSSQVYKSYFVSMIEIYGEQDLYYRFLERASEQKMGQDGSDSETENEMDFCVVREQCRGQRHR